MVVAGAPAERYQEPGGHLAPVKGELIYSVLWLPNEEFPASWGVVFSQVYCELWGTLDSDCF